MEDRSQLDIRADAEFDAYEWARKQDMMRAIRKQLRNMLDEQLKVMPFTTREAIKENLLNMSMLVYNGQADKITTSILGTIKVTISRTAKGNVKITRVEQKSAAVEIETE